MKKLGKILLWTVITLVVLFVIGVSPRSAGGRSSAPGLGPSLRASSSAPRNGWSEAGISSLHQPDAQDVIRCMTGTSMAARS